FFHLFSFCKRARVKEQGTRRFTILFFIGHRKTVIGQPFSLMEDGESFLYRSTENGHRSTFFFNGGWRTFSLSVIGKRSSVNLSLFNGE
ncbi:MAG: hypothetical protein AAF598_11475, partial [Bacteroidota bacterium]